MEIAIPFVALAGAYIISNQNKNSDKNQKKRLEDSLNLIQRDGFNNMGKSGYNTSSLPNTDTPTKNYPVSDLEDLTNTVHKYDNPNSATDKYFNANYYENRVKSGNKVGSEIQSIYSLTGDYLESNQFKHNNMVPFYGAKIKGQLYDVNLGETILDNMVGSGSQTIKKIEQAPLFKPENNVQWVNGSPNMSDFYQSRVNPGMNNANNKPFQSENVGPGLGLGYTTDGSGGYNSGMNARDSWLPKTVDELRVATNPKLEYSLENHEGPSYSHIQNVGILGKVEKYHPDTFFINTQDRWLTTTGQEKGQSLRPIEEVNTPSRTTNFRSYAGVASANDKTASYVPCQYTEPKRSVLNALDVPQSTAVGRGPINDGENFIKSHTNYSTNRATTRQPDTIRSSFSGSIGAVIAPIMDIFRPTRKEEYSSNIRVYGDVGGTVSKNYVINPFDVPSTTIKETTIFSPDTYIGNQASVGHVLHNQQAITNQRDTTTSGYIGSVGGYGAARTGEVIVDAAYRQTNNDLKEPTLANRANHGSNQIYNQQMNVSYSRLDSDRDNNRMFVPNMATIGQTPIGKQQYGNVSKPKQQYDDAKIGIDRIQPDLLDQFRANPYTFSLTSSA